MAINIAAVLLAALVAHAHAYSLQSNFSGANFFDNFNFWTGDDPTHGYVNFVSYSQAQSEGLIYAGPDKVIIGSDDWSVSSGRGRDSIRITSNEAWNSGLFVLDAVNMPTGCGTWPAWWLVGPNWPNSGEIDIIEGVNVNTNDQTTLHTNDGCVIDDGGNSFSGYWATGNNGQPATDCNVNAPNEGTNQGCGIISNNNYGTSFNQNGGGVYALEWTGDFIRAFFWTHDNVPGDLLNDNPNPNGWGQPYAYFALGGSCPNSHFNNMNMVFDLTFCGDWAGAVFANQCPGKGDCQSFVQNNPSAFNQAYWWVKYVKVFQ